MSTTHEHAPTEIIDVGGVEFAYRQLGPRTGVPLVFLHHFTAVLDDWDPRVIDGIAAKRHVIAFDNRGIGASGGSVPHTIDEMAADAVAFIRALGYDEVDLLGFSLGGGVAQVITLEHPELVRRVDPCRHGSRRRWRHREDQQDRGHRVHQGRAHPARSAALPVLQQEPGRQARRDRLHGPAEGAHRGPRQAHLIAGQACTAQGDSRGRPAGAPRPREDHASRSSWPTAITTSWSPAASRPTWQGASRTRSSPSTRTPGTAGSSSTTGSSSPPSSSSSRAERP